MRRVKRGEAEQTIVDLTDNRKLIVMISTSKARQIIYNPNNGTYSPDFSKEPMVLTPELYITGSSTNVIATAETVKWYVRPNTLGQRIPIENNDTYSIGDDFKLTISKNIMKDMLTMEFILEVIYKEPDSDFRTTIPHHMELINISMGENGRNGVDGLDGLDGERGLPGPKGADGESSYTHLAYANNETGTQDFSLSDSNRSYIGMYVDNLENDSTNPSDYKWTKVEGMPGDNGIQGPKGADGRTPYFHIAYATNDTGTEGFSVSDSLGKTYIGQYTDYIENDSTKPSDYSWTLIKGEQGPRGLQGIQGDEGLQGPKGLDSYTHIAYANNDTGTSGFSTSNSIDKLYIGMYVDSLPSDSTNPSDYKWTKARGDDGTDGADGIPGKPGIDGKTPYFHTAYANSEDGVTGFSTTVSKDKLYLGQYTDYVEADSDNPSLYSWTKIKGDPGSSGPRGLQGLQGDKGDQGLPGPKGANGESSYTHIAYANNETGTSGFSVSDSINKLYIGMYVDNLPSDSTNPSDYYWTKIKGEDGKDGVAGKDGVGISNTVITYAQSANGTTAPSTGYTTTVPTLTKGNYLWTKTVWTYTDKTTETGYSVAYIAKDGNNGSDGIAGKDGVGIKTTTITYAKSTSGTVKPTTGYTATIPVVANGQYLWTKTTWTYTDNTTEDGYSVAKMGETGDTGPQGIPGKAGSDGRTPYLHIAYANNSTGTSGFSNTDSVNKLYIGQYTDYISTSSTNPSSYTWTLIKGDKGDTGGVGPRGLQGLQGPQGNQGVQGPKGLDSYTHIAYSTSPTGATGFSTTDSTNKTYIGMYVDNTKADSTNPSLYNWTLIKGADGGQGIPGKAGADGKTPYLHIAYADGTANILNRTGEIEGFGLVSTAGSLVDDAPGYVAPTSSTANKIEVAPGTVLVFKKEIVVGDNFWRNSWFDTDGNFISRFTPSSDLTFEVVPPGAKWLRPSYPTESSPSIHRITAVDTGNSNKKYIGHYTDYISTDSSNPSMYNWTKIMGEDGEDSATLAIITPDGTTSRDTTNSLRLDSKLFVGGREVTAGSYKWYYSNGSSTVTHSTGKSTSIGATLIKSSLPVFLDATYNGTTYTSSVTLNDISDVYTSIILGVSTFKNGKGTNTYTVKLYRNGEEIDTGGSQYTYEWEKLNPQGVKDTKFTKTGKTITINASEIDNTNLFNCYIYTK